MNKEKAIERGGLGVGSLVRFKDKENQFEILGRNYVFTFTYFFGIWKNWCFWTVVLEKTLESPLDCKEIQPVHPKGDVYWRDWCWSWNSNTLAIWCGELTHLKKPWCWERLRAEEEGDNRGWDGWMASPTQWTWVWVDSRSWWWTGRPGLLRSMGSQRVGHDWPTELNWWVILVDGWIKNCLGLDREVFNETASGCWSCLISGINMDISTQSSESYSGELGNRISS